MMKAILILLVGLLFSGDAFAKEIKVYHKDENSISVTRSTWNRSKTDAIAAKHCTQHDKFAFRFQGFYNHGALNETGQTTYLYHCSRRELSKSPISGKKLRWTNYDPNHEFAQKAALEFLEETVSKSTPKKQEDKKFEKLEGYKRTCEVLGFEPGTDKFADCALKLFVADNKDAQVVQSSSGTQEVIIRDPDREQRIRLRKFNDRISGKCGWTDWNC